MHSIAWLLNDLFFGDHVWIGFLIEAVIFFIVAAVAGLVAYRAVQAGAPPTPDLAIEEGKRIRQTLEAGPPPPPRSRRRQPPDRRPLRPGSRGRERRARDLQRRRRARRQAAAGAPGRSSAEIRADIERQRQELSQSVEALRGRVTELTDWRRQVREHRRELVIGAAVVGFAVGGLMMLRRGRRR